MAWIEEWLEAYDAKVLQRRSRKADGKAILTENIIHKVVREVYRGRTVDDAFEIAGVDPDSGNMWLRGAENYH